MPREPTKFICAACLARNDWTTLRRQGLHSQRLNPAIALDILTLCTDTFSAKLLLTITAFFERKQSNYNAPHLLLSQVARQTIPRGRLHHVAVRSRKTTTDVRARGREKAELNTFWSPVWIFGSLVWIAQLSGQLWHKDPSQGRSRDTGICLL